MRWLFNPSGAAAGKSLDETTLTFESQRNKDFTSMFAPNTHETGSKKLDISKYRIMIDATLNLHVRFILNRGESDVQNL